MTFIPRYVYKQLQQHLSQPEISILLGPRQAGKTTIIDQLRQELDQQHQPTVWLNLDVIEHRQFFVSQHALLDFIAKQAGSQKVYVFIDEISRLENAGLFLKGLYDLKSPHKFIVTGSGSLELKANIIEPLTGRKQLFYCFPLSFTEFADYKSKTLDFQPLLRQRLITEYINFGGYPRVALAETTIEKVNILREIYTSYLEKDIALLLKIDKEHAFANLVKILASQVGSLVNRSELSGTLGLTEKTLAKYLYLLEKTFVISLARPFYRNVRKELTKSPKVYFVDLGLLHIAQGIVPSLETPVTGPIFENACYLRLQELDPLSPIQFWRTKSGAEVDFIITNQSGKPVPIETKLSAKPTLGKSLISFINKYQPDEAFIYLYQQQVHTKDRSYQNTTIHWYPYHHLPLLKKG